MSTALNLIICTILVICVSVDLASAEPTYSQNATEELNSLWQKLQPLTGNDNKFKIIVTQDLQPGGVKVKENGEVIFPVGAHMVIHNACTMAEYIRVIQVNTNTKTQLFGAYTSYLSSARDFGNKFYEPEEFLARSGLDLPIESYESQVDNNLVQFCRGSMLAFLLAHEFAHLQLKHKFSQNLAANEIRQQEIEADQKAIEFLLEAKILPVVAIFQYFPTINDLMNRPGGNEEYYDHPLPHSRLISILSEMLKFIDRNRLSGLLPDETISLIRTGIIGLSSEAERRAAVSEKFENTSGKDDKLLSFASQDPRYGVMVSRYYLDGGHGVSKDLSAARALCYLLIQRFPKLYLLELAKLKYNGAEAWSQGNNPDYKRACMYLSEAAQINYIPAVDRIREMRNNGLCQ
jgi:hypothetical protein